mmetsp:Transcript_4417/g.6589  ORF Transcript_4417/g.6589 Transcript_4417/m.6589 type:complete len:415 (+) Transcript_4417:138-1382(+)
MSGFNPIKLKTKGRAEKVSDGESSDGDENGSVVDTDSKEKRDEEPVIPLIEGWNGGCDKSAPMLIRNMVPGINDLKDEKLKFKRDLEMRPKEHEGQFDKVEIEDFGRAMLRGMGWKDEKKEKDKVKATILMPRPQMLGLGALPKPAANASDAKKKGHSNNWLCNQAVVKINSGKHQGEFAVVKQADSVPGLNNIIIQLDPGADGAVMNVLPEIIIQRNMVELVNHLKLAENHPGRVLLDRAIAQDRPVESEKKRGSVEGKKRERSGSRDESLNLEKKKKKKKKEKHRPEPCWLVPGIRVRVVSRSLAKGRYYSQKGVVTDVLDPVKCTCEVAVGEGQSRKILGEVYQDELDTALPRRGGKVLVVSGRYKGEYGKLIDRDSARDRATVQFFSDMKVHKFSFVDVAEFCFETSESD